MSPRRRGLGDTIVPTAGDGETEAPAPESAFDIAQGLLSAALDEVRTSPSEPVSPAAALDTGAPVQARRQTRRRRHTVEKLEPEGSPTAPAAAPRDPAREANGGSGVRRRSRRPAKDVAAPGPRESDLAMLASIEVLDREADRIRGGSGSTKTDLDERLSVEELAGERGRDPGPAPNDDATLTDLPAVSAGSSAAPDALGGQVVGRRMWIVVGVLLVGFVIAVAAVAATIGGGGSDGSAGGAGRAAPDQVRFAFDPVTTPEGLKLERVWALQGKTGDHFVGRLSFANPTSAPVIASHIEVLPKTLASSVDDVRFDPEPVVLAADPVVQYSVTVPAGKEVVVSYEIAVDPDGAERGRLESWADDLRKASQAGAGSTTTAPPPTAPPSTTPPSTTPTSAAPAAVANPPAPPPPPPPSPPNAAIVVRTASQGTTGTFGYAGPGGSAALTTSKSQSSVQSAAIPVAAGTYSWTQVSAPPGSSLVGIGCSDSDSGGSGATATFNVQAGETVVCTWTNR